MGKDPLVEAFEARGEEGQALFLGELLDHPLVELAALRGERDDAVLRNPSVDGVERSRDHVDPQHHPRPAPVRSVVHLAVRERRRVAVAEEAKVDLGAEHRRERPLLGEPPEGVRNQREDVDLQGRLRLAVVREAGCNDNCARSEVDPADALLVHRQGDAGVELEHVVRHPWCDLLHSAEPPPTRLPRPPGPAAGRRSSCLPPARAEPSVARRAPLRVLRPVRA